LYVVRIWQTSPVASGKSTYVSTGMPVEMSVHVHKSGWRFRRKQVRLLGGRYLQRACSIRGVSHNFKFTKRWELRASRNTRSSGGMWYARSGRGCVMDEVGLQGVGGNSFTWNQVCSIVYLFDIGKRWSFEGRGGPTSGCCGHSSHKIIYVGQWLMMSQRVCKLPSGWRMS